MYISQAFNVLHEWWRYLVGLVIIIIAVIIGQIPFTVAVFFQAYKNGDSILGLDEQKMMSLLEPNLNLFLMLLSFAIGLVGLLLVAKYLHKETFTQLTTSRKKIDWKRFWFIFILWGLVSSSFVLIDYYYFSPDDYVVNFKLVPFIILSVIAILLVPLQTSFEEYLFRGYLMQGIGVSSIYLNFPLIFIYTIICLVSFLYLNSLYSFSFMLGLLIFAFFIGFLFFLLNQKTLLIKLTNSTFYKLLYKILSRNTTPLLVTSFAFGLLHISNPEVDKLGNVILIYYIGTGLFLGIMTLMDEGMELSLGFHAANNLFTALLVTADWTAFQTHSILKDMSDPTEAGFVDIFMPVFIVFPIILLILSKKYRWTNWKEKLFGKVEQPQLEN